MESVEVQLLYLVSGPGGAAQEFQAGFDGGFVFEAVDIDTISQPFPAIMLLELDDQLLKGNAVQGVIGLASAHQTTTRLSR